MACASFVHASWTYDLLNWCLLDRFANGRVAYFGAHRPLKAL